MRFQTLRDVFWLLSDMAEDWAIASVWKMTDDLPSSRRAGARSEFIKFRLYGFGHFLWNAVR